jgi:hypothetical protein
MGPNFREAEILALLITPQLPTVVPPLEKFAANQFGVGIAASLARDGLAELRGYQAWMARNSMH